MKISLFSLLLLSFSIARADIPPIRQDRIPGISSLEIVGDRKVDLRLESHLSHLLADGTVLTHSSHINLKTGQTINTPEEDLHFTITVGESVAYGVHGYIRGPFYKLVQIENGTCIFEVTEKDNKGKETKTRVAVSPYPPRPNHALQRTEAGGMSVSSS